MLVTNILHATDLSVVEELYSHWFYNLSGIFGLHASKPITVLL